MSLISDTLYARYVQEREGALVIENETSFLTYKFQPGYKVFICNCYTAPESRKSGGIKDLVDRLSDIAVQKGCDYIAGTVHLNDKGATNTLAAAIAIGFKVEKADQNQILITKDIRSLKTWAE